MELKKRMPKIEHEMLYSSIHAIARFFLLAFTSQKSIVSIYSWSPASCNLLQRLFYSSDSNFSFHKKPLFSFATIPFQLEASMPRADMLLEDNCLPHFLSPCSFVSAQFSLQSSIQVHHKWVKTSSPVFFFIGSSGSVSGSRCGSHCGRGSYGGGVSDSSSHSGNSIIIVIIYIFIILSCTV